MYRVLNVEHLYFYSYSYRYLISNKTMIEKYGESAIDFCLRLVADNVRISTKNITRHFSYYIHQVDKDPILLMVTFK